MIRKGGIEFLNMDKRKSKRTEYYSKIKCIKYLYKNEEVELEEPIDLMLVNVSTGGLGVVTDKKFESNTILVLDITLEDISYEKVSAKVMWNSKIGDMHRHGLEICRISGRLFTHLHKLDNSITTHV